MTKNKQKLELTWIGKGQEMNLEPRILVENPEKSYGDPNTENMLIHGDNLLALKALEQNYTGKIKCIYIDPPYNTGSAFEHYDDNVEHSKWLSLMKVRLEILKNLLSDDGVIFVQIDDNEQAYLKILMDEVFGRNNFINMVSVNMKNIAGASGGGEDKRLKKNCEYILIYSKDYAQMPIFKGVYDYEEISELVKRYKNEGKSWKYTSALVNAGNKKYIGSTVDGDGNEIKIFERTNYEIKSVNVLMKENGLSEKEVYKKFAKCFFQTAMPQSSIRPRVMQKVQEIGMNSDLYSIEYVPKTGRNKGTIYEQFYKGENFRLFAWLKDVATEIDGELYKKDLQGTYWDFVGETKNLTKEGNVEFPNGKKPESLISRIIEMSTEKGDFILDSFLGSGTTTAVAHKMERKWIGIELGDHCYTHCEPRLQRVVDGTDQGGISKALDWKGGGGYKFYELAPSLLKKDEFGNWIIDSRYDAEMLAEAMAKQEGYQFSPDEENIYKQGYSTEKDFIFTTTQFLSIELLDKIYSKLKEDESLLICATHFEEGTGGRYDNITVKKIPQMLLNRCEFGKLEYNLNIIDPPQETEDDEETLEEE